MATTQDPGYLVTADDVAKADELVLAHANGEITANRAVQRLVAFTRGRMTNIRAIRLLARAAEDLPG